MGNRIFRYRKSRVQKRRSIKWGNRKFKSRESEGKQGAQKSRMIESIGQGARANQGANQGENQGENQGANQGVKVQRADVMRKKFTIRDGY